MIVLQPADSDHVNLINTVDPTKECAPYAEFGGGLVLLPPISSYKVEGKQLKQYRLRLSDVHPHGGDQYNKIKTEAETLTSTAYVLEHSHGLQCLSASDKSTDACGSGSGGACAFTDLSSTNTATTNMITCSCQNAGAIPGS